ncbi:MAG: OmpA family protein [Gammaproteobacteria bacterium]|nr:OmpA family protein [Gammaproteobacteria bacterium]
MKLTAIKFVTILLLSGSVLACSSKPQRAVEPVAEAPKMQITTTERGELVTLDDVLFDFEKATLRPEAKQIVKQAASYLNKHPKKIALIEGHTDNQGDAAYNDNLSKARSQAVRETLLAYGVDNSRIQTRAYGESRPVASNATLEGRQQNRRVEIIFNEPGTLVSSR